MLLILDLLKGSKKNKTYSLYIDSPVGGFTDGSVKHHLQTIQVCNNQPDIIFN
jgi:hypothetical protein